MHELGVFNKEGKHNYWAMGSQDMKCVGIQYLEAIRRLKASGFKPKRSVYLSYGPDEEIGGHDGAEKLAESDVFKGLNVGIVLDEGGSLLMVFPTFIRFGEAD
ncbi:hypothetical protein C1H46_032219 [Malus baccata]|uniref:Peptidase M20 dimerisation domain-containing protein n=1 Tax=Malus baccata TaxID=106549 RepID=A0A540L700_MALBA|nr:hypothetical protein C1H46_032219 [Malus baccata]